MARQRIHNSRSGTGAGNAGASWISYSDMMAALLLVFVLILSVSLYQYFTMLETTKAELDAQQAQLAQQQIILLDQQAQLDEQTMLLASQQITMDNQSAMIIIIQGQLEQKESELAEKESALLASQAALDQAYIILGQKEQQLLAQQEAFRLQTLQLDSMVGVRTEIISEVSSSLSSRGLSAVVDPKSGDIMISSKDLTFETNSAKLTADSKAFLDTFVPVYLEVLMRPEYADYLGSIIIEGHTDQVGSYETNMKLSQERALAVLLYIRGMYANDPVMLARLDQILVCTGKGYSDPVYYTYNGQQYVDQAASRRVEFKFSLRDAEMIEEINRLLNGE